MLPSMPLLMTPVKELNDDSSDTSDDSPFPHLSAEDVNAFESNNAEPSDKVEETDQLFPSGSIIEAATQPDTDKISDKPLTPEKRSFSDPTSAQKKKKKTQHKKTLVALTPDNGESLEHSAQNFAEAYFQKVRSQLDDEKWTLFVQELVDFEEKTEKQPTELYKRMEVLLSPHTELIDEFLAFLLPHQALEVDRFMTYLVLVKMKEFFRKLNILLMKRQTRHVYTALEALANRRNVTLAEVKATILPLLKSSPLLTNHFLQLLPGERPPDSLMTDFEQVDLKDDSQFETVVVPDCPDPYGNDTCICSCHMTQKNRHCISCGIKYVNGRVYLQYGKVLRPAKVTFKGNKHMDLQKWEEDKCRSRRRFLPKTMLSPNCFDHRINADSEDDCGVKKSPRTPRIRAARAKVCKKVTNGSKEEEVLEGIFPLCVTKPVVIGDNIMGELVVDCGIKNNGNEEQDFDEVIMENECNTEEDEEEDLNKCVHSENESSIEGEDIVKEIESGNDCSFEDEEVEDIESNGLLQHEMPKGINEDLCQEDNLVDSSLQNSGNHVPTEQFGDDSGKTDLGIKEKCEDKSEKMDISLEHTNHDAESTSDIQDEKLSDESTYHPTNPDVARDAAVSIVELSTKQTILSDKLCETIDLASKVKLENTSIVEPKLEIMDVDNEQCSSSVKVELTSPEGIQQEGCDRDKSAESAGDVDSSCKEWTREEDKIILQTFQHENGLEQTFETASLQLPNRSKEEIQERFEVLLKLLKEMISDESNSNP